MPRRTRIRPLGTRAGRSRRGSRRVVVGALLAAAGLVLAWLIARRHRFVTAVRRSGLLTAPPASVELGQGSALRGAGGDAVASASRAFSSTAPSDRLVEYYEGMLHLEGFRHIRREEISSPDGEPAVRITAMTVDALAVVTLSPEAWTDADLPDLAPSPSDMRTFVRVDLRRRPAVRSVRLRRGR